MSVCVSLTSDTSIWFPRTRIFFDFFGNHPRAREFDRQCVRKSGKLIDKKMTDKMARSPEEIRSLRVREKRIGEQLKRLYDDVVSEPVPDDFMNLLERADEAAQLSGDSDKVEG